MEEFYNSERKKICLLDDNFLGYPGWKDLLQKLIDTGKPFKFKQGLDERILTDEKCEMLFSAKYDCDYTFAFDNLEDYELIRDKLRLIRKHLPLDKHNLIFYVLCGFNGTGVGDIESVFKRVRLLFEYGAKPYIMRYQSPKSAPWKESPLRGMYVQLARWCNQPSLVKKKSFREFCMVEGNTTALNVMNDFEKEYPKTAKEFFDMKFGG